MRIEDIGYWAIITSVKSLVLLSITFFTIYLMKVIADENNKNSESVYLTNSIVLTYLTMIIPLFLFLTYMTYQYKDLEQYIYISLIPVITTPLGMDFYFQAKLKNDYLLYRKLFVKLIVLVCLFLFVRSETDFIVYVWIISLSLSFEHLINFYFIKKHIVLKTIKLSVIKDIFKNSIGYLPFNTTYNQLPAISIILGAYFLDIKTLAVITILLRVINLITTFVSSTVMVLFPLKIKLSTSSLKESFEDKKYLNYTILFSLAIIICLIFSKKLIFYIFLHNYTMPNLEIEFIILSFYILIHSVYNYLVFNYYLIENKSIYISWLNIIILIIFVSEIFLFNLFNIKVYFALVFIIPPTIMLLYLSYKLSLNNKTSQ